MKIFQPLVLTSFILNSMTSYAICRSYKKELELAVYQENLEKIKMLADKKKVNLNKHDLHGMTPVHVALEYRNADMLSLLLVSGAKVDLRDKKRKETPLIAASRIQEIELVNILLAKGASVKAVEKKGKQTALHANLAAGGNLEIVKLLLEYGASLQKRDAKGRTPLHIAARDAHFEVFQYLAEEVLVRAPEVLQMLDDFGQSPFNIAEIMKRQDVVQFLRSK